ACNNTAGNSRPLRALAATGTATRTGDGDNPTTMTPRAWRWQRCAHALPAPHAQALRATAEQRAPAVRFSILTHMFDKARVPHTLTESGVPARAGCGRGETTA